MANLPALQLLATGAPTANLRNPAGLVLECLLSADAWLLNQERAFGARGVVLVTRVLDRRVSASRRLLAVKSTVRRPGSARLRRL
jgi:hypothetical protein